VATAKINKKQKKRIITIFFQKDKTGNITINNLLKEAKQVLLM
jgi:hypothetical protein